MKSKEEKIMRKRMCEECPFNPKTLLDKEICEEWIEYADECRNNGCKEIPDCHMHDKEQLCAGYAKHLKDK